MERKKLEKKEYSETRVKAQKETEERLNTMKTSDKELASEKVLSFVRKEFDVDDNTRRKIISRVYTKLSKELKN